MPTLPEDYWTSFEAPEECVEGVWKNCCTPEGKFALCLDTSANLANGITVKAAKPCQCHKEHYTPISPRIVIEGFSADDIIKMVKAVREQ